MTQHVHASLNIHRGGRRGGKSKGGGEGRGGGGEGGGGGGEGGGGGGEGGGGGGKE